MDTLDFTIRQLLRRDRFVCHLFDTVYFLNRYPKELAAHVEYCLLCIKAAQHIRAAMVEPSPVMHGITLVDPNGLFGAPMKRYILWPV